MTKRINPRPTQDSFDAPRNIKRGGPPNKPPTPPPGNRGAGTGGVTPPKRPAQKAPVQRPATPVTRGPSRPVHPAPARGVPMNARPTPTTARPITRGPARPAMPQRGPTAAPTPVQRGVTPPARPGMPQRRAGATGMAQRPTTPPSPGMRAPVARPGMPNRPGTPTRPSSQPSVTRRAGEAVVLGTVMAAGVALAPEIASAVSSLNMKVNNLNDAAGFNQQQSALATLNNDMQYLFDTLENVRARGYIYGKDLDSRINTVSGKWEAAYNQAHAQIQAQSAQMYDAIYPLETQISRISGNISENSVRQLSQTVDRHLNQARQAASTIERNYQPIQNEVSALKSELTRINWMMDNLDEASFQLEGGENPVAAVRAVYDVEGKNDPNGFLYLTNKRVIYERKEEVATKKVLFITTEKELVQELLIDEPITNLGDVKHVKKGLFGGDSHLELTFSGGKVRTAKMDIKGQSGDDWVKMINAVKRGEIENDKAVSAGFSVRDLNAPVTASSIVELQQAANELQGRASLSFATQDLGDTEQLVNSLDRDLQAVRAAGYPFESDLEGRVQSLMTQWSGVRETANQQVSQQSAQLAPLITTVQTKMAGVMAFANNPEGARGQVLELRSLIASAESQSAASEEAVVKSYGKFLEEVQTLNARFEWVFWMLDALSQASFRLYPTEGGVAATEVLWRRDGSADMPGILFLTDQRLIFEEHEGEFSVMIDVPLQQVENVQIEDVRDEGVEEEHLILSFAAESSSPVRKALFVLLGPTNEEWQRYIGRARAGEYVNNRAEKIDPAELERLKNAPAECSSCGGTFTEPLVRGQNEITCFFCGSVTRF